MTDVDADRIAVALQAAYAETTRAVYDSAWQRFATWCAGRDVRPFPADPATIWVYLVERADQGRSLATIDSACSAIGHRHRSRGVADPIAHPTVRQVRRGLRRIIGRAPRRPAHPLSVDDLRRILAAMDRTTAAGARDAAILLVGFAGALRRSELADLRLADLQPEPGGLLVHLRRSKTDQEGHGQIVGIAHGHHDATDPVAALDAWLGHRGREPGHVFTSLRGRRPSTVPLSGQVVSKIVTDRANAAGLGTSPTGERVTAHSLRAGHATTAAIAGVNLDRIAAQTRHRRVDVLVDRYIRPTQMLHATSSKDLGL